MCLQLSQLIVNAGGVAAVVDYIGESKGNVRLPGIMMLGPFIYDRCKKNLQQMTSFTTFCLHFSGYVAAHSENLAMAVFMSKVV